MDNPFQTKPTTIAALKDEAEGLRLFTLAGHIDFQHGQFVMIGLPGFGEAPFDICSDKRDKKTFEVCVRKVGVLTERLFTLKKGDKIWVRGPYGHGFPELSKLPTKNILMLGGGTGFITLRSIVKEFVTDQKLKDFNIQLYYGARDWSCLLFKDEYKDWREHIKLDLVLEHGRPEDQCATGLITDLFQISPPTRELTVIMCGPPVMYKFVLQKVKALGVKDENIFLSMERRMFCGQGVCEHCGVGPKYVCKDGPVFTYAEAKLLPNAL